MSFSASREKSESSGRQVPGTFSPVLASLFSLFGGPPGVGPSGFTPSSFGGPGAAFQPGAFAALPGLLQNQPLTGIEQFILGSQPGQPIQVPSFDQAAFQAAVAQQQASRGGDKAGRPVAGQLAPVDPAQFFTNQTIGGGENSVFGGGLQGAGLVSALQAQGLLGQGAAALPALLETDPASAIAAARRGFTQETLPAILERAPGFSSSDLQRELSRAGVDLETNIAALREANLGRVGQVLQGLPGFAQAVGSNLLGQAAQVLGFGTLGRQFTTEAGPAGDAFRVLSALATLEGGPLVQFGRQDAQAKGLSQSAGLSSRRFKHSIRLVGTDRAGVEWVRFRYLPEIDPFQLDRLGVIAEQVYPLRPDAVLLDAAGRPIAVDYGRLAL